VKKEFQRKLKSRKLKKKGFAKFKCGEYMNKIISMTQTCLKDGRKQTVQTSHAVDDTKQEEEKIMSGMDRSNPGCNGRRMTVDG
jgi:hypothetical protein